jgi:hypothetical protein
MQTGFLIGIVWPVICVPSYSHCFLMHWNVLLSQDGEKHFSVEGTQLQILKPSMVCCDLRILSTIQLVLGAYAKALSDLCQYHSLEEFTGLMKGQIAARNIEDEIRDTFAVFGAKSINIDLLRLMVQVCPLFSLFGEGLQCLLLTLTPCAGSEIEAN